MVALMATMSQLKSSPIASTAVLYKSVVGTVRLANSGLKDVHPSHNDDALDSTRSVSRIGRREQQPLEWVLTHIPLSHAKGDDALGT